MELKKQNLLIFTRTMQAGGTENVVLGLCEVFGPLVNKIVVCSGGGLNVDKLAAMKIQHYQIPDIENKNPLTVLHVVKRLKTIVKQEHITVIHTHHRMAAFYISAMRLYKKCLFINTSHNVFEDKKRLTQFAYKKGNLIACGERVKENLTGFYGLAEKQVKVIRNGVKPFWGCEKENPFIKELHNQGYFLVGNVGRLSEQKGMEYFIRAIPEVVKRNANVRFLMIGSGEKEEELKLLAKETGAAAYLYFLGYRDDVQNLMAQLDLLVLSSLWEGLPLTPMEAYSVGRTIVATAVDGTVEIVRDGIDGFLVPSRDSHGIAERISYMVENDSVRHELERNAAERYQSEFSFEVFAEAYISYYEGL